MLKPVTLIRKGTDLKKEESTGAFDSTDEGNAACTCRSNGLISQPVRDVRAVRASRVKNRFVRPSSGHDRLDRLTDHARAAEDVPGRSDTPSPSPATSNPQLEYVQQHRPGERPRQRDVGPCPIEPRLRPSLFGQIPHRSKCVGSTGRRSWRPPGQRRGKGRQP